MDEQMMDKDKKIHCKKQERERKVTKATYYIGLVVLMIALVLIFTVRWIFATYGNITIDSIIFTMTAPLSGTDPRYIYSYLLTALLPIVLVWAAVFILTNNFYKKNAVLSVKTKKKTVHIKIFPVGLLRRFMLIISLIVLTAGCIYTNERAGVRTYIINKTTATTLYDDYYADASEVSMEFPEQKRNLIYLYVESLEKTLESKAEGGGKADNKIPNLTRLQKENVAVADENGVQAHVLNGGGWTIAGMVSQTAGVPLMSSINGFDYNPNSPFLPGVYSLGEVLAEHGYVNELITGCDGSFAGTNLYFKQHGNYEVIDTFAAREMGYIPEDYIENWGYEDVKMFEILKSEITKKAESGVPFNITAATLDTHADDVYICEKCEDQYTEPHDKTWHCTDNQIKEFVEWFKQQPCYENTTLVISGDHLSMATTYYNDCADYERSVFTAFINPAVDTGKTDTKTYSTLDMFPSTLAALGVKIEGERLGLGTNIFSDTQTLCEILGVDELNQMLSQKSVFYDDIIMQGTGDELIHQQETSGDEEDTEGEQETQAYESTAMLDAAGAGVIPVYADGTYKEDYEKTAADVQELYENYYVDAGKVNLEFPEKKRNLVYIFIESLEVTLEDQENGGARTQNVLPNITQLKKDHAYAATKEGKQANALVGGDYTMAGTVSQTSGLPLVDFVNGEGLRYYNFIPKASTIGDILKNEGYQNVYISGFDCNFANANLFFTQHGEYEVIDTAGARERGYIAPDYVKNWGYEDSIMYEILKDQITQKSESGEPFNITAATMDSHNEDVYLCDECPDTFTHPIDRAFNCSDARLAEFIEWFEDQPCYENTTLVITGDHLDMAGYFNQYDEYGRTVCSVFVNSALGSTRAVRGSFCTLDMFPTTLAAMGVKIPGERLGLGTNLFSKRETLCELFTPDILSSWIVDSHSSPYYNENIGGAWE